MLTTLCPFFRLLKEEDKGEALLSAISGFREGSPEDVSVFLIDPAFFRKVPNSPFAYWVDDAIRELFSTLPPFESEGRTVKVGLQTSDDFRFLRAWWEVPAERRLDAARGSDWRHDLKTFQDWCRHRTHEGKYWVPFAKGGEYSPYYADIHLVVNWKDGGSELDAFEGSVIRNPDFYFLPGLTWPARTTSGYAPQVLPSGIVFGHRGQAMILCEHSLAFPWLGAQNTRVVQFLMESLIGLGDSSVSGSAARDYTTGLVSLLPFPEQYLRSSSDSLIRSLQDLFEWHKRQAVKQEICVLFSYKHVACVDSITASAAQLLHENLATCEQALRQAGVVEATLRQGLKLSARSVKTILDAVGPNAAIDLDDKLSPLVEEALAGLAHEQVDFLIDRMVAKGLAGRSVTKKSYFVSRTHELIAELCGCSATSVAQAHRRLGLLPLGYLRDFITDIISFAVGIALGRWDIRMVTLEQKGSSTTDPFDPLPICPPATLMSPNGLPATTCSIVSEEWLRARPNASALPALGSAKRPTIQDDEYPLQVPWNGILVDDPGQPDDDIVARVRKVLELLWKDRAFSVEQECCIALGVSDLREYFRKPGGYFQNHLARYSKSRRKAPIYWPLSTKSGSYILWVYYPRLTEATLYDCVNNYVAPKLEQTGKELTALRVKLREKADAELRRRHEELIKLDEELSDLRAELLRVAALPFKPDLDDGVVICAAPLRKLFRLGKWQKELEAHWAALEDGKYDWAHLANAIWPKRVEEKCRTNRSLAIAHGLEHLCTLEGFPGRASSGSEAEKEADQPELDEDEE